MKLTNIEKLIEWIEERLNLTTVQGIYEKAKSLSQESDGWINVFVQLPKMVEGKDYSENVIAWVNGERKIMNYAIVPDDNNNLCFAWCMVYDGLDGDAEFDDNYFPTHWQPLPNKPKQLKREVR